MRLRRRERCGRGPEGGEGPPGVRVRAPAVSLTRSRSGARGPQVGTAGRADRPLSLEYPLEEVNGMGDQTCRSLQNLDLVIETALQKRRAPPLVPAKKCGTQNLEVGPPPAGDRGTGPLGSGPTLPLSRARYLAVDRCPPRGDLGTFRCGMSAL
jgi:hypothetical protein